MGGKACNASLCVKHISRTIPRPSSAIFWAISGVILWSYYDLAEGGVKHCEIMMKTAIYSHDLCIVSSRPPAPAASQIAYKDINVVAQ